MEFRTTKKAVMAGYDKVICAGYCTLQNLLSCESRTAYTCGVYGWNADVYDFGNVAIVTGARPFGNVRPDWDDLRAIDKRAEQVKEACRWDYESKKAALRALIQELLETAKN